MLPEIRLIIKNWLLKPSKPGPIYILKENYMARFKLNVALPPLIDSDVATRELTYKINDADAVVVNLKPNDVSTEFLADRDTNVHLQLVDIDLAGNRSEPSVRDFVVTDTIPPHKPGDLAVTITDQVDV